MVEIGDVVIRLKYDARKLSGLMVGAYQMMGTGQPDREEPTLKRLYDALQAALNPRDGGASR